MILWNKEEVIQKYGQNRDAGPLSTQWTMDKLNARRDVGNIIPDRILFVLPDKKPKT